MTSEESPRKKPKAAKTIPLYDTTEETKVLFSRDFKGDDAYKLVAVNADLLAAIEKGEKVCLKGSEGKNDAVLCTEKKTYQMKKVETSNTVLLVPPGNSEHHIVSKSTYSYELTAMEPKLDELRQLLSVSEYKGYEEETESRVSKSDLYTRADLENLVLSSPG